MMMMMMMMIIIIIIIIITTIIINYNIIIGQEGAGGRPARRDARVGPVPSTGGGSRKGRARSFLISPLLNKESPPTNLIDSRMFVCCFFFPPKRHRAQIGGTSEGIGGTSRPLSYFVIPGRFRSRVWSLDNSRIRGWSLEVLKPDFEICLPNSTLES